MSEAGRAADPQWRRSRHSGSTGGQCVEVAADGGLVRIRDSKDPGGPQVVVSAECWRRSVSGFATGPGLPAGDLAATAEGDGVLLRDAREQAGPVLRFTPGEWLAFRRGAADGEFDLTTSGRLRPLDSSAGCLGQPAGYGLRYGRCGRTFRGGRGPLAA
jgi:hypothetical protein